MSLRAAGRPRGAPTTAARADYPALVSPPARSLDLAAFTRALVVVLGVGTLAAPVACAARNPAPAASGAAPTVSAVSAPSAASAAASPTEDPALVGLCEQGDPYACRALHLARAERSGDPKAFTGALKEECESQNYGACARLADRYAAGLGTAKDLPAAVDLYGLVCLNGFYGACLSAAHHYREGRDGVPLDVARASKLEVQYFDACEYHCHDSHDGSACTLLGVAYLEAVGTRRNVVEAVSAFEAACDGGDAEGCYRLARCHADGLGVTKSDARAAKLYEKACAGGFRAACATTGR